MNLKTNLLTWEQFQKIKTKLLKKMQALSQALKSQEARETKVSRKKISKSLEEKEKRKSKKNTRKKKKNLQYSIHL